VSYLSVDQLSINFGGLRAVDHVTFAIQEGQIHGLIGPNGAGKTTIFNCITGFYHPTSGTIHFRGQDITHLRPDQIACRIIWHCSPRHADELVRRRKA
jgi:branched-chain amino acid transport system ATP-binding protein